jgi:hypothetical protein
LINTGYNLNDAGAGVDGQSDCTLDIANTTGTANYMWKLVRSANVTNQNDLTAAGADIIISYNPQANAYLA